VNIKNSFSVLSNIPEASSGGRVGESNATKEKGKQDSEYNLLDSDSEVDEVMEDDAMGRFMANLSESDVYGLMDGSLV